MNELSIQEHVLVESGGSAQTFCRLIFTEVSARLLWVNLEGIFSVSAFVEANNVSPLGNQQVDHLNLFREVHRCCINLRIL